MTSDNDAANLIVALLTFPLSAPLFAARGWIDKKLQRLVLASKEDQRRTRSDGRTGAFDPSVHAALRVSLDAFADPPEIRAFVGVTYPWFVNAGRLPWRTKKTFVVPLM